MQGSTSRKQTSTPPKADEVLDTVGTYCPVPVWEAAKKLQEMRAGQVLKVVSDDEGIEEDMPTWCERTGNEYLGAWVEGEEIHVFVRKTKG